MKKTLLTLGFLALTSNTQAVRDTSLLSYIPFSKKSTEDIKEDSKMLTEASEIVKTTNIESGTAFSDEITRRDMVALYITPAITGAIFYLINNHLN